MSAQWGTTTTGMGESCSSDVLTEPRNSAAITPRPRAPTTIRSAARAASPSALTRAVEHERPFRAVLDVDRIDRRRQHPLLLGDLLGELLARFSFSEPRCHLDGGDHVDGRVRVREVERPASALPPHCRFRRNRRPSWCSSVATSSAARPRRARWSASRSNDSPSRADAGGVHPSRADRRSARRPRPPRRPARAPLALRPPEESRRTSEATSAIARSRS